MVYLVHGEDWLGSSGESFENEDVPVERFHWQMEGAIRNGLVGVLVFRSPDVLSIEMALGDGVELPFRDGSFAEALDIVVEMLNSGDYEEFGEDDERGSYIG